MDMLERIDIMLERWWSRLKGRLIFWWQFRRGIRMIGLQETCTNCGRQDTFMPHCHMRDRCIKSQNDTRVELMPMDEVNKLIRQGKRITIDNPRPLCFKCANANDYMCAWCELERSMEKNK